MFNIIIVNIVIFALIIFFCYYLIGKYNKILSYLFNFYPKNKYMKIIKNKYDIKSTEKTKINKISNLDLKLIAKKPYYFKFNHIKNENLVLNLSNNSNELKNHIVNNKNNEKIIKLYIYNKNIFSNLFYNSDENKIKDLDTFNIFYQNNIDTQINYNILMKFFNNKNEYLYVYVNDNNLVKIINNDDYDYIVKLIENNNNIFMIQENSNGEINNYITHCDCIESKITKEQIKKIFFINLNKEDKNFITLKNFSHVKIFYYVSTLIKYNN